MSLLKNRVDLNLHCSWISHPITHSWHLTKIVITPVFAGLITFYILSGKEFARSSKFEEH
mgnify:CR=1